MFSLFLACVSESSLRPVFATGSPDELTEAERLAAPTLAALAAEHGIADAADLPRHRVWVDALGTAHVYVRQALDGVPVLGAEAIVHLDADGSVAGVTDALLDAVSVDTEPTWTADDVAAVYGADPTLVILRRAGDHLAWRVPLPAAGLPVVFVDAHDGEELWSYDTLRTGTGRTSWYGEVTVSTTQYDARWYLQDPTRRFGTFTFAHGTDDIYYLTDGDDRWPDTVHEAVEAHYATAAALDYYQDAFGRAGIDGAGGPGTVTAADGSGGILPVIVQHDDGEVNAAWTGRAIVIGSGDGEIAGPFTTLDVVGHELTHGVVEHSAGLLYQGESGALDESLADCFGAMIERSVRGESDDTWRMAEATWTPGTDGDALRYLDDPAADGSSRDHYADRYTGRDDNGGVHDNSGIGNLAFYLAAKGGVPPRREGGAVEGIGVDAAAATWYRALTTYMTVSTSFAGARTATVTAAADLYGADAAADVAAAWDAVGVGEPEGTDCPPGYTRFSGTVTDEAWIPDSDGYTTDASGTHHATAEGFALALYRLSSSGSWYRVESGDDEVTHAGEAGTWRVRVSGEGAFTVCLARP